MFGSANAPALNRYLKGEIDAAAAARAIGWREEQWRYAFALIIMRAASGTHPTAVIELDETSTGTVRGHRHGEAFCLMKYKCENANCGREEWLWNSRDGVTPFCITCPACLDARRQNPVMQHVDWHRDRFVQNHQPKKGDRYFRDGTPDEAVAIVRARIDSCKGTQYERSAQETEEILASVATSTDGEFQPGWPTVDVWK